MGYSNEDNGDDDHGDDDDREHDEGTEEKLVVPDTGEVLKDRFNHLFIKFTREKQYEHGHEFTPSPSLPLSPPLPLSPSLPLSLPLPLERWGGVLSFSVKLSCDTHQGKGERVGNSPRRGRGMGRGRVVEITISLEYALKYVWVLK